MSEIMPNVRNEIIDQNGNIYESIAKLARKLDIWAGMISNRIKTYNYFEHNGIKYFLKSSVSQDNKELRQDAEPLGERLPVQTVAIDKPRDDEKEYQEFLEQKKVKDVPFEKYEICLEQKDLGTRYAIALFSDAHIEETVTANSVMGLNEYDINIAEERIKRYFSNLANCLIKDDVNDLIFASLGDTISGYIHDELSQTNSLTPLEATLKAQSLIYSGLKFICENVKLHSIKFIGIVGNHSRTTKKIQHSNGYRMSYEWLMYQNIKTQCESENLPIEFYLPESELAVLDMEDGKRFIFVHGFQVKSMGTNTVCGIYPALNRLSMKWGKTFNQDKIYLGHFHSCISIPNAMVNGSIMGYNSFALTNGFTYERPAQQYEVYDTSVGLLLNRQIYCD